MSLFYIKLDLLPINVDATLSNYVARFSTASIGRDLNSFLFNKISITDSDIWFSTDKNGSNPIPSKKVYWSSANKLFAFDIKFTSVSSTSKNTIYMQVGYKPSGYSENPYLSSVTSLLPLIENLNDITTNANNGIAIGGVTAGGVTGPDGHLPATSFDGTNDLIETAPGTTVFPSADDASWELWFYDDNASSGNEVLVEAGGVTQSLSLHLENGSLYGLYNDTNIARFASSTYTAGQWNYAVVTREDSGPTTLYINGISVATNSAIINISAYGSNEGGIGSNHEDFRLSNQSTSLHNTLPFEGYISNVKSNDALVLSEEVKLNYALQGPNSADNWIANLSFVGKINL